MLIFKQLSRFSGGGTSINNILILIRQVKKIFKSDFSFLKETKNFNAEKKELKLSKEKTREEKNQIKTILSTWAAAL